MQPQESFEPDRIRQNLDTVGYAYTVAPDSGADLAAALARLGRPVPQYGPDTVRRIAPDPRFRGAVHAQSQSGLSPHTELYEFAEIPPRYVVLHCIRQAEGDGGETLLADGYRMLDAFSGSDRELLFKNEYEWTSLVYEHEGLAHAVRHPVLRRVEDDLVFTFSTRDFRATDELAERYLAVGQHFFAKQQIAVKLRAGTVLVWDNWRMYHARTAFHDPGRLMHRMLLSPAPAA